MTRYDPSIRINELKLYASGTNVYHGIFHDGVNVIRSEDNSCGKSTIMNFIYFLLGGEDIEWPKAAKNVF